MTTTLRNLIVTAGALVVVATGAPALVAWPGASASVASAYRGATVTQSATASWAAIVRYWTRARMSAALRTAAGRVPSIAGDVRQLIRQAPAAQSAPRLTGDTAGQGLRWTHGGAVAAATGKVFFTLNDEDYVCSGTLIGGEHPSVVVTAAHCVGSGAQWATNWMFAPGFHDGLLPYGEYTARRFFVSPQWTGPEGGTEQYDVAFVPVTAATLYGASGAAQPPPGLPAEFAAGRDAVPIRDAYVFGYPSEPPYSGLYPSYCAGPVTASRGGVHAPCSMTAGDSGGPWLAGFDPRSGTGVVAAISTYKLAAHPRVLYGAVLGPQARALYSRALSSAR